MEYHVYDDGTVAGLKWTADEVAEALTAPLKKIGVIVRRMPGYGGETKNAFRGEGLSKQAYRAKLSEVGHVVDTVIRSGPVTG